MTVHSIQILAAPEQEANPDVEPSPGPPTWNESLLRDRMQDNVIGAYREAVPSQSQPMTQIDDLTIDGRATHIKGVRRFSLSHSRDAVLDAIVNGVVIDAKWYRLRYHECTHDGTGGPCGDWYVPEDGQGNAYEKGNVPL